MPNETTDIYRGDRNSESQISESLLYTSHNDHHTIVQKSPQLHTNNYIHAGMH